MPGSRQSRDSPGGSLSTRGGRGRAVGTHDRTTPEVRQAVVVYASFIRRTLAGKVLLINLD